MSIGRHGYEALWGWFGLSRSSFLTMPRAFMHEMPDLWQARMAQLCEEWDNTWKWPDEIGHASVSHKVNGRFASFPEYIINYRHPDTAAIAACRLPSTLISADAYELFKSVQAVGEYVAVNGPDDQDTGAYVLWLANNDMAPKHLQQFAKAIVQTTSSWVRKKKCTA